MPNLEPVKVDAHLWNGQQKLSGKLSLSDGLLKFTLSGFEDSHLDIHLTIADIVEIEEFLLYDISLNGLYLKSKSGREDHFILTDPVAFRKSINQWRKQAKDLLQAE